MKRIVILTTGGTIAMRADAEAGGAVPSLGGSDFLATLPRENIIVVTEEFSNVPSAHFTLDQLWSLSRRVAALGSDKSVDGVVITHGTDTLEESAYLCDLTVAVDKPVVFTGAMRASSDVGYEGIANLAAAVRVAADDMAGGLGTLVVFNDCIHTAADVTKTHTTALDTFQSPGLGPIGYVDYGGVWFARRPFERTVIPSERLEPNVHLLKLVAGMPEDWLDRAVAGGARGIVLEALGGGRVPPWWLPAIDRAIKQGVAIVVTSRTWAGRTVDRYGYPGAHKDLQRLGCWFAMALNGQKARIRLMVALGTEHPEACFEQTG